MKKRMRLQHFCALLCLVMFFLSFTSEAGVRSRRKIGLGLEGYQGNFGIITLGWNVSEVVRLQIGAGGSGSNSFTAYKGGLKYLFIESNFSPYVGAEFWSVSGSASGVDLSVSAPSLIAGLDYTFDGGFNLGAGAVVYSKGLALGTFYVSYYF